MNRLVLLLFLCLLTACSANRLFENGCDIGNCKLSGSYVYSAENDVYSLTGSGVNMWERNDEFYMVWKEVSGDFKISAQIAFEGEGVNAHRKMGLIIRESLEPGSKYADVAVHGDGLTSLQYRMEKGDITQEIRSENQMPDHIVLERLGDMIIIKTGNGRYSEQSDATLELSMPEKCYAGMFICSHEADVRETGHFSNVRLEINK